MRRGRTARGAAGLILLALLCGCHDWAATDDVAGDVIDAVDAVDAVDGEGLDDTLDLPPDVPDRGDDAADAPDDGGGEDGDVEADVPDDSIDDVGPEALPVCGNGILEPGEFCERESYVECTTSCGSRSSVPCPNDCGAPSIEDCPPPAEVCNGRDEDCDGHADNPAGLCTGCVVVERGRTVYHYCSEATWIDASAACRGRGMYLVTVDDAAENDWLATTAATMGPGPWWLGYNDRATEGVWVWDGPTPAVLYTSWGDGEPNDYGTGEDCAELLFFGTNWNDSRCDAAQPYVCEYP